MSYLFPTQQTSDQFISDTNKNATVIQQSTTNSCVNTASHIASTSEQSLITQTELNRSDLSSTGYNPVLYSETPIIQHCSPRTIYTDLSAIPMAGCDGSGQHQSFDNLHLSPTLSKMAYTTEQNSVNLPQDSRVINSGPPIILPSPIRRASISLTQQNVDPHQLTHQRQNLDGLQSTVPQEVCITARGGHINDLGSFSSSFHPSNISGLQRLPVETDVGFDNTGRPGIGQQRRYIKQNICGEIIGGVNNVLRDSQGREFYRRPKNQRQQSTSVTNEQVSMNCFDELKDLYQYGVPIILLLPDSCINQTLETCDTLVKQLSNSTGAFMRIIRNHFVPNLRDKMIVITGPTREIKQTAITELLQFYQSRSPSYLVDKDGFIEIVTVVPEKAVSFIIGTKGTTINRISKLSNCDIRVLSSLQLFPNSRDITTRIISIRSNDCGNVSIGVTHINLILTDMYYKHKLTEQDFIHSNLCDFTHLSGNLIPSSSSSNPTNMNEFPLFNSSGTRMTYPSENVVRRRNSGSQPPIGSTPPVSSNPITGRPNSGTRRRPGGFSLDDDVFRNRVNNHTLEGTTTIPSSIRLIPFIVSESPECLKNVMHAKEQLTVKLALVGCISAAWVIGNSGLRKKEIEAVSFCTIKIHNHPAETLVEDVKDGRVLVLKGTPMGIGKAINLILVGFENQERRIISSTSSAVRMVLSQQLYMLLNGTSSHSIEICSKKSGARLRVLTARPDSDIQLLHIEGIADAKVSAILLVLETLLYHQKRLSQRIMNTSQQHQQHMNDNTIRSKRRRHQPLMDMDPLLLSSTHGIKQRHLRDVSPKLLSQSDMEYIGGGLQKTTKKRMRQLLQQDMDDRAITIPPEAMFLQYVANGTTYPRVMTTSSQYTCCISFGPEYRQRVDALGIEAFHEIEAMISYRVGSTVQIIRLSDDEKKDIDTEFTNREEHKTSEIIAQSMMTKENSIYAIKQPNNKQNVDSNELLRFQLTGTPIGNSTAVLLLHEVLMNLDCIQSRESLKSLFYPHGELVNSTSPQLSTCNDLSTLLQEDTSCYCNQPTLEDQELFTMSQLEDDIPVMDGTPILNDTPLLRLNIDQPSVVESTENDSIKPQ